MSNYQDGYDKGYQDGLEGTHRIDTWIADIFIPTSEAEEEWRNGYENGYKDGEEQNDN